MRRRDKRTARRVKLQTQSAWMTTDTARNTQQALDRLRAERRNGETT